MAQSQTLIELPPAHYDRAAHLFEPFDVSLAVQAVLKVKSPGVIWVDDPDDPNLALSLSSEDYLIAGDPEDGDHVLKMGRFLREEIFSGQQNPFDFDSMTLGFAPARWLERLPEMLPAYPPEPVPVYKYSAESMTFDWRSALPEGFSIQKVDEALLDSSSVTIPEDLSDFFDMDALWFSREDFLARGGGMAVVHDGQVVSWCVADLALEDVIEVGIITLPDYRQQGLAAIAAAAMVEDCLGRGYQRVSWQCNQDNIGSWKTAEKVGFKRRSSYIYYYFMFDLLDHFAELGWYYYKRGDYARTAAFYEQVFKYRNENPIYYLTLAAAACGYIGDTKNAFAYLNRAVDAGWDNLEWLRNDAAFESLRDSPAFEHLCQRIGSASTKG